ncbi:UNVERIFIED_CONTAM: hypothetical protein K2H54_060318 [Gekko kuhli]
MNFGKGALMGPVQLNTGAELLYRTIKWGFCLTVLTLHPVSSDERQGERNCTIPVEIVAQEGDSVEVPLNTSKTISDLFVWDNLTMVWVYVWDFSNGKKYSSSFKEHVSMVSRTFRLLNVSKDTHGNYKLQDNDANCVALINVSVRDLETTTHLSSSSAPGLIYPRVTTGDHRLHWVFLLQFLAVLLFML